MKSSEPFSIRREMRTYRKIMLTGFALALLTDGLALIPPVIMQFLIDDVIPNGTLKNAILLVVLFISLPVVNGLISALRTVWAAMKCRRASYVINSDIIDHIMGQPMRFHVEKSSAELASECSRSSIDYTYLWTDEIPKTAATLVTSLIALVLLFRASGWIALSQILSPKLTTWKQNTGELGTLAASCLIDLIEHPKTALIDRRIVSGSLLEGETVSDLR